MVSLLFHKKVSNRLNCYIGRCHQSCTSNTCWGPKPSDCQQLNKVICADQCDYRCFGPEVYECCRSECLAGCGGSSETECWVTKALHITAFIIYHYQSRIYYRK